MPGLPDLGRRLTSLASLRARGALAVSSLLTVAVNLLILAGVLFFGWMAFDVVLIYWLESVVIGVFTVLKLKKAKDRSQIKPSFFVLHYSMFSLSMFFCIVGFFGPDGYSRSITPANLAAATRYILGDGSVDIFAALISFVLSHGYSYRYNYLEKQEYRDSQVVKKLIQTPYLRLMLTILTVVFTSHVVSRWGWAPSSGAALLVVLKAMTDVISHRREHAAAQRRWRAKKGGSCF